MTDTSGSIVWKAAYNPFGKAEVDQSSMVTNNFRFPGQYYDAESGLHYNWNRYYDPGTGRYMTVDLVGVEERDDLDNIYVYAANDPILFVDPFGLYRLKPGVPAITNPELDALLRCMDKYAGQELTITSTTEGRHQNPCHAAGTCADIAPSSGAIPCWAGKCGAGYVLDETKLKTKYWTGPHYHVQLFKPNKPGKNAIPPDCVPKCPDGKK
jgi:RHS repeat-associated protein